MYLVSKHGMQEYSKDTEKCIGVTSQGAKCDFNKFGKQSCHNQIYLFIYFFFCINILISPIKF